MKTLFIDLETAPNLAHVWGLWNQNVSIHQLIDSGYTLCFAAKWKGNSGIEFHSIFSEGSTAMIQRAFELIEEADAVVHYNGNKFDMPTLHKEFLLKGYSPPAPYKNIDLLRTVKKAFRFPSNKLDYMTQILNLGSKTKHIGHELWIRCMNLDEEAWKMMEEYNIQDVLLLEKLYDRLLPWISNHPNTLLYKDQTELPENEELQCPICQSRRYQKRGYYYTNTCKYQRYKCSSCGHWYKTTANVYKSKLKVSSI